MNPLILGIEGWDKLEANRSAEITRALKKFGCTPNGKKQRVTIEGQKVRVRVWMNAKRATVPPVPPSTSNGAGGGPLARPGPLSGTNGTGGSTEEEPERKRGYMGIPISDHFQKGSE